VRELELELELAAEVIADLLAEVMRLRAELELARAGTPARVRNSGRAR
jgi:hypothetical protein